MKRLVFSHGSALLGPAAQPPHRQKPSNTRTAAAARRCRAAGGCEWRRPPPGPRGAGSLAVGCIFLAQELEQLVEAAVGHDVLELGAEVLDEADAVDGQVDDLPRPRLGTEAVVHLGHLAARLAVLGAGDHRQDGPVSVLLPA